MMVMNVTVLKCRTNTPYYVYICTSSSSYLLGLQLNSKCRILSFCAPTPTLVLTMLCIIVVYNFINLQIYADAAFRTTGYYTDSWQCIVIHTHTILLVLVLLSTIIVIVIVIVIGCLIIQYASLRECMNPILLKCHTQHHLFWYCHHH